MNTRRIALAGTIAAGVAAGTLGAGTAVAAPSGAGAQQTIANLQAQGNKVILNKIGSGPLNQCSLTSVSPVRTTPLPTSNPLTGVPNMQRTTTVYVTVKC